jgi:hypothetical protein
MNEERKRMHRAKRREKKSNLLSVMFYHALSGGHHRIEPLLGNSATFNTSAQQ